MVFLIKYLSVFIGLLSFAAAATADQITHDKLMGATPYISPSCNSSDHREFDFMLGSWDLKVMVDGKWVPGGYAEHTNPLGGCVHMAVVSYENLGKFYKSLSGRNGYAGIALHSYDKKSATWRQVWHDDMGTVMANFRGRKRQGGMYFVGNAPFEAGSELQRFGWRVTGENLREFTIDMSTEGGTEWTEIVKVQMYRRR